MERETPTPPLIRRALRGLPAALLQLLVAAIAAASCGGGASARAGHLPDPIPTPTGHGIQAWVTTPDQTKLLSRQSDVAFGHEAALTPTIDVDERTAYQEMIGFGATITDASAWLIQNRLSALQRDVLMGELFGQAPGIGLSFVRLTIGSSDFSRSHYSLDDRPPGERDSTLGHFSIEPNRADLLPLVKRALALNPDLKVMASPWSAPAWMKSTGSLVKGTLRPDAFGAFAQYLLRYIEAYAGEGVPIFAITVQNEPHFEPDNYPGMRLDPAARARFTGHFLGPLFARRGVHTRILEWDHNWDEVNSPLQVLSETPARQYVSGVAWHCYAGDVSAQSVVHDAYPTKDAYFTECSGGEWAPKWGDNLQWFVRTLIVGATRHWAKGVLLWNLALDEQHGPHTGGCNDCRGVVTINSATGEVTRNVEYYALAHASRFVRQGATRIAATPSVDGLESVAFRNVNGGSMVLITVNTTPLDRTFSVQWRGSTFPYALPAGGVATFVWR